MNKKRALFISAFALAAVLVLWACGKEMTASESADKFLTAVQEGDFDGAKKYATDETADALGMMGGDDKEKPEAKKVEIVGEEVDGDKATVKYTLDGGEEKSLKMEKQGTEWKAIMTKEEISADIGGGASANPLGELGNAMNDLGDALSGEGEGEGEGEEGEGEGEEHGEEEGHEGH